MSGSGGGRVPVFGDGSDLDLSGFEPKPPVRPEQVRGVAEQAGFRSREVPARTPTPLEEPERREPRRYRTGRNIQLNLKVRREAVDAFYKIADERGWVLGEAFERAVAALEQELQKESKKFSDS